MCTSLQSVQALHIALHGLNRAKPRVAAPRVNIPSQVNERVSKVFLMQNVEELDPQSFSKGLQGNQKIFIYGDQSIAARFHQEFDEIDELEKTKDLVDQQEDTEEISIILGDEIAGKNTQLKEIITQDFSMHLSDKLGPGRQGLIPKITALFAMNAFMELTRQVNDHTTAKYNGIFMNGSEGRRCILTIPDAQDEPVQITAEVDGIYTKFIESGKEPKDRPVVFTGKTTYTLKPDDQIEVRTAFSLNDLK